MRPCFLKSYLDKKRGKVQWVWGSFKLTGLKLIIALPWQLRAQCTLVYSAKEQSRCILVIWNNIPFPNVSLNYLHLIWYVFFIWHLPECRFLQYNGNTVEGLLPSEFVAKDLLQHFIPVPGHDYFWGTATEMSCQNRTSVELELSGTSSRAQERVTHTINDVENNR